MDTFTFNNLTPKSVTGKWGKECVVPKDNQFGSLNSTFQDKTNNTHVRVVLFRQPGKDKFLITVVNPTECQDRMPAQLRSYGHLLNGDGELLPS